MEENKNNGIVNFYFSPIIIPIFLIFLSMMSFPVYSIINVAHDLKMYLVATLMLFITLLLLIRVLKYFIMLIKHKPALVLDESTLHDYQKNIAIKWEDIQSLDMRTAKSTTYISIKLKKNMQEKYIQTISNPLARAFYRISSKVFFGTFTINVNILKGKNEIILHTIESHLVTSKK